MHPVFGFSKEIVEIKYRRPSRRNQGGIRGANTQEPAWMDQLHRFPHCVQMPVAGLNDLEGRNVFSKFFHAPFSPGG